MNAITNEPQNTAMANYNAIMGNNDFLNETLKEIGTDWPPRLGRGTTGGFTITENGATSDKLKTNAGQLISQLDMVVLDTFGKIRNYYSKPFDPNKPTNPDCISYDNAHPDMQASVPQNYLCQTCKWNAFNTALVGKGKACKEIVNLAVLITHPDYFGKIYQLQLKSGDWPHFNDYVKGLKAQNKSIRQTLTTLSFHPDNDYVSWQFSFHGEAPEKLNAYVFDVLTKRVEDVDNALSRGISMPISKEAFEDFSGATVNPESNAATATPPVQATPPANVPATPPVMAIPASSNVAGSAGPAMPTLDDLMTAMPPVPPVTTQQTDGIVTTPVPQPQAAMETKSTQVSLGDTDAMLQSMLNDL